MGGGRLGREGETGREGGWERGRLGEREAGREGGWERGRLGEREAGREGGWERRLNERPRGIGGEEGYVIGGWGVKCDVHDSQKSHNVEGSTFDCHLRLREEV
jgi:hypothetical protein